MTDDTTYNEEISNQIKDIDGIISSMSMAQTREPVSYTHLIHQFVEFP